MRFSAITCGLFCVTFFTAIPFQNADNLAFQLFPVRQVQLIAADEQLIGNILRRVFHHQLVFVCSQNNTDWFCIPLSIHFLPVIIQVQIHLPDIFMLNFTTFQIDQDKTFQNTMIKYEIHLKNSAADIDTLLSAYIGESDRKSVV